MTLDPRAKLAPALTLVATAAAALVLAGCGSRDGGAAPSAAPRPGGVLTVGLAAEPDSLNIYLARALESVLVANRVLPRLAREVMPDDGRTGGLEPELASSWEDRAGGTVVAFRLEPGRWSNGVEIRCEDLQFTLGAQTSAQLAWRSAELKRHIARIECPDPRTALVVFDSVRPTRVMDANDVHILPRSLASIPFADWRRTDWGAVLPAGGPFKIARVAPGQEVVLARNEGWRGAPDRPYIEQLVLRVVPDADSRVNQLLAGDLDLVDNLQPEAAARVAADPATQVIRRRGWSFTYLGWMTVDREAYAAHRRQVDADCPQRERGCPDDPQAVARLAQQKPHPLFGDARVRRAMTLAINREGLIETLLRGEGEAPASPILAPLPEHDPALAPLPYDPARSRTLLAEAGFQDRDSDGTLDRGGRPFVFDLAVQAGASLRRNAAVLIQNDLAKVGVGVRIVLVENSAFMSTLAARTQDAWIGGWATSLRMNVHESLHANNCGAGGLNFGAFSNPEADRLADRAVELVDDAARVSEWRKWEALFHEQQPYTMLLRPNRLIGVRTRVRGAESAQAIDCLDGVENWWLAGAAGKP